MYIYYSLLIYEAHDMFKGTLYSFHYCFAQGKTDYDLKNTHWNKLMQEFNRHWDLIFHRTSRWSAKSLNSFTQVPQPVLYIIYLQCSVKYINSPEHPIPGTCPYTGDGCTCLLLWLIKHTCSKHTTHSYKS